MKKNNLCLYNTVEVLDGKNWSVGYISSISSKGITVLGSLNLVEWKNVRGAFLDDAWFEEHCFINGDSFADQGIDYQWSELGSNYVIKDVLAGNIITTVKYVHEAENLFAFLTGYDIVSIDNLEHGNL
jgi:hypothetical protein